MVNPYEVYLKNDVETASPVKQIVLLYEKAIVCLKQAVLDIQNGDLKSKIENINKATDILNALNASLDMEKGKEIAENLRDLYDFAYQQILIAHAKNDTDLLNDIIDILETLKSAWEEING